jgi:ribosomal protein S8
MDEKLYNLIRKKYGKGASWAIWNDTFSYCDDPFSLGDYEKVKDKINPNVVFVGFNPSDNIIEDFSNFHNLKNDKRNLHQKAICNANKLKYAFINTEYVGAYMTDIIKLDTVKGKVKLADSAEVKKYIRNNPEVKCESIKMFKEELDFIGSKNPFIIALGGDAYNILSKFLRGYSICKVTHYAVYSNAEEYKERVWKEIRLFKSQKENRTS